MKRTLGNFMKFSGRNFPLDCEGLRDMQDNEALLSVLGNIGGDKYKLTEFSSENQWSGYMFLKTKDFPEGEVLWVARRPPNSAPRDNDTLFVKTVNIDVPAQGHDFSAAYTTRHLAWGLSPTGENYSWGDFSDLKTNVELAKKDQELESKIELMMPAPVGSIMMWARRYTEPTNWLICDGRVLQRNEYPELFDTIGTRFGGDANTGVFNLPDMRTRFPVGYRTSDIEFGNMDNAPTLNNGRAKGTRAHTLSVNEMPRHRHDMLQDYNRHGGGIEAIQHFSTNQTPRINVVPMNETGGNQPHNNLPPYFVVNYIIRAK